MAPDGTVVLCSTDLSHYLDEASARRQDERTVRAVLGLAPEEIGVRDACGVYRAAGPGRRGPRAGGSAATCCTAAPRPTPTGDPSRVVGYAALAVR